MNETLRVCIYCRVSTDEQAEKESSLPAQIYECLKWVKEHGHILVGDCWLSPASGFPVPEGTNGAVLGYMDDFTGFSDSRPGLDRLYGYVAANKPDLVVCWNSERLARGAARGTVRRQLKKHGAATHFISSTNNPDTADGRFLDLVQDGISQLVVEKWVEESISKKQYKAREKHKWPSGRPPFGYRINPEAAIGGLDIYEPEAEIVRRIFAEYLAGQSGRQITLDLMADHVPSPGGSIWRQSTVNHILRNEAYAGVGYYGKLRKSKLLHGDEQPIANPDPDSIITFPTPVIIARDVFDAVQARIDHNREHRREQHSNKRHYLLSGRIGCADCGKAFLGLTPRPSAVYYRHIVSQGHCRNQFVRAEPLESEVWKQISRLLIDSDYLESAYQRALEKSNIDYQLQLSLLETHQQEIAELKKQHSKLLDLRLKEVISDWEMITKRDQITERIGYHEGAIAAIEDQLKNRPTRAVLDRLTVIGQRLRNYLMLAEPPFAVQREVLELLNIIVKIDQEGRHTIDGWVFGNDEQGEMMNNTKWRMRNTRVKVSGIRASQRSAYPG